MIKLRCYRGDAARKIVEEQLHIANKQRSVLSSPTWTQEIHQNGPNGGPGRLVQTGFVPGWLLSQVRRTGVERAPADARRSPVSARCHDSGAFSTISVILICMGDGWRSKQTIKWRREQAIC